MDRRVARVDFGGIAEADAVKLLAECERFIFFEVRRWGQADLEGLDLEDLAAIGRLAVLEAAVTHVEGRGRSLRSWARQMARWRIQEAARRAEPAVVPPEVLHEAPPESADPDRLADLRRKLAALPARSRYAVTRTLEGASVSTIATELGVTRPTVYADLAAVAEAS